MAALPLQERLVQGYKPKNAPDTLAQAFILMLQNQKPTTPPVAELVDKLAHSVEIYRATPQAIDPNKLTISSQEVRSKFLK